MRQRVEGGSLCQGLPEAPSQNQELLNKLHLAGHVRRRPTVAHEKQCLSGQKVSMCKVFSEENIKVKSLKAKSFTGSDLASSSTSCPYL